MTIDQYQYTQDAIARQKKIIKKCVENLDSCEKLTILQAEQLDNKQSQIEAEKNKNEKLKEINENLESDLDDCKEFNERYAELSAKTDAENRKQRSKILFGAGLGILITNILNYLYL